MRKLLVLAFFVYPIYAQYVPLQGWCEKGGQKAIVASMSSSTYVQASYPLCTAYVTLHGGALGTVKTVGTTVSWVSGNLQFNASMNGLPVIINSVGYVIQTVSTSTSLTLLSSAGSQTGAAFSINPAPVPVFSAGTGGVLSNPVTSDSTGRWKTYVALGDYDVT